MTQIENLRERETCPGLVLHMKATRRKATSVDKRKSKRHFTIRPEARRRFVGYGAIYRAENIISLRGMKTGSDR